MATRLIGLLLLMTVLAGAGCKKAPAAVEAKKNTTPRDAMLALLHAMRDADAAKVAAACQLTAEQRAVVDAGSEYTRAVYVFRDAIVAAYGKEAWDTFQDPAKRPGDHDATFILITDREVTRAEKELDIEQTEKVATCMMPTGAGRVRIIKLDDGTWIADGVTFVPAGQVAANMTTMITSLTELVKKYQRAVGKPGISASDIDYELGREIDFLITKRPDNSRHRFEIDKL